MSETHAGPIPTRSKGLKVGAAAAVLVAAAVGAALLFWPETPNATAKVHEAADQSASKTTWSEFSVLSTETNTDTGETHSTRADFTVEGESVRATFDFGSSPEIASLLPTESRSIGAWEYLRIDDRWTVAEQSQEFSEDPANPLAVFLPAELLRELRSVGDFEERGEETLSGVSTTRYAAIAGLADLGRTVDAALGNDGDTDNSEQYSDFEIWVDGGGLVRQILLASTGQPGFFVDGNPEQTRSEVTIGFTNDQPARVDPPPRDEVSPLSIIETGKSRARIEAELAFRGANPDSCRSELASDFGRSAGLVACLDAAGGAELADLIRPLKSGLPQTAPTLDTLDAANSNEKFGACIESAATDVEQNACQVVIVEGQLESAGVTEPKVVEAFRQRARCQEKGIANPPDPDVNIPIDVISECDRELDERLRAITGGD